MSLFRLPSTLLAGILGSVALAACSGGTTHDAVGSAASGLSHKDAVAACNLSRQLQRDALGLHGAGDISDDDSATDDPLDDGRKNFRDRKLHDLAANGRSCADCHGAADAFQLTPAAAKARFDALQ